MKYLSDQADNKSHEVRQEIHFNENIATPKNGAKVIKGISHGGPLATNLLSGKMDTKSNKYTYHEVNKNDGIVIDLGKVQHFNRIRVLPYNHPIRKYSYCVDVSTNQNDWKIVAERNTSNQINAWHEHTFESISAKFIRIKGSNVSNPGDLFVIVSLEAYFRQAL